MEVTVDVPPQVARHEGYATAFLEMPAFSLEERYGTVRGVFS